MVKLSKVLVVKLSKFVSIPYRVQYNGSMKVKFNIELLDEKFQFLIGFSTTIGKGESITVIPKEIPFQFLIGFSTTSVIRYIYNLDGENKGCFNSL